MFKEKWKEIVIHFFSLWITLLRIFTEIRGKRLKWMNIKLRLNNEIPRGPHYAGTCAKNEEGHSVREEWWGKRGGGRMKTSRDTKWRFVERIHRVIASNFVQSCEIARFHRGTIIQSRFWSRLILLNLPNRVADKADYDKNPVRFTIAGRNCAYSQKRSRFSCFSIFYLILYNVTWKLYIYIYEKLYIYIFLSVYEKHFYNCCKMLRYNWFIHLDPMRN